MISSATERCVSCGCPLLPRAGFALTICGCRYVFCSDPCMKTWQMRNMRPCFVCGNIVSRPHWIQFGDGRISCRNCFSTAILEDGQLGKCLRRVSDFFLRRYRYTPPCGLRPELCDTFVFQTDYRIVSQDTLGVYGLCGCGRYTICRISILRGLPETVFEETLAHEIAHDMMFHQWGECDDLTCAEGFACYIQTQFNIFSGREERNRFLLIPPDAEKFPEQEPYYKGLQMFLKLDLTGGYSSVCRYLERNIQQF